MLYTAAIFLPLLGAFVSGFFGREIGARNAQLVTCGAMVASAILSIVIFYEVALQGSSRTVTLLPWIVSGAMNVSWSLMFDTLTAVMLVVVNVVSAVVHVYSVGYMEKDPHTPRFFAYLSLFTFAMLMLVTSDNLVQLFFGWEGVGLCSYLLIGFWFERPSANAAAIKAFIVNRVGDFGFALGIFAVFALTGSVSFSAIFAAAPELAGKTFSLFGAEASLLTLICLLLFVGAMGKSAQLGLHTWLPDAMEGPTPVSALIHAATMVTAGVFMVARLSPLFEYAPAALTVVAVVGASTAFFAATVALTQNDIKRVIAYSTCSQLGYMFFAIGVSAYPAAIFHLMTHAFFKALLFLGAGSVIHAMSDEQDMRNMGGIWNKIPTTYALMWIGSLALAGVPFFAGYYSKDIILESAWASHSYAGYYAYAMGIAAAFLTAFYSWRLIFMTFHGTPRADEHVMAHVHESPRVMLLPLVVLSVGAIFAGYVAYNHFVGHTAGTFWREAILILEGHNSLEAAHHVSALIKLLPTVVALGGILLAFIVYFMFPGISDHASAAFPRLYAFLLNKWYFDELYDRLFVRPALSLGRGLWKAGDGDLIDGIGPDGVSAALAALGKRVARFQTGYLHHYALAMIVGVAALVSWYFYGSAG